MSPLQRQVLRRYFAAFAAAWVVLTLVVIAFDCVKVLFEKGLTPGLIASVLPYLVPSVARTAVQGAVLFAVCFVYGRMAAKNEFLALNAAGVSAFGIVWPALLASVPLSLACARLDDVAATWGKNGVRRVICEGTEEIAYSQLRTRKTFRAADFELGVQGIDGRLLIGPKISKWSSNSRNRFQVRAAFGRLAFDASRRSLVVVLSDGILTTDDGACMSFADEWECALDVDTNRPGLAESRERIREQELRIERLAAAALRTEPPRLTHASGAAMRIPTSYATDAPGEPAVLRTLAEEVVPAAVHREANAQPTNSLDEQLAQARGELHWRRSLWHQKWANSFCCSAFTLIGIPVAVRCRRTDPLSSFLVCFLPVLAVYQPLQFIGMAYATRGVVSPWWLHANNAVFGTFGVIFLTRSMLRR